MKLMNQHQKKHIRIALDTRITSLKVFYAQALQFHVIRMSLRPKCIYVDKNMGGYFSLPYFMAGAADWAKNICCGLLNCDPFWDSRCVTSGVCSGFMR